MIQPIEIFKKYNWIKWILYSKLLFSHSTAGGDTAQQSVIVLERSLNDIFWFLYVKESLSRLESDELAIFLSELDQLEFKKPIQFDSYINFYDPFCRRTITFNRIKKFESVSN